jgi:hypothetical protein
VRSEKAGSWLKRETLMMIEKGKMVVGRENKGRVCHVLALTERALVEAHSKRALAPGHPCARSLDSSSILRQRDISCDQEEINKAASMLYQFHSFLTTLSS